MDRWEDGRVSRATRLTRYTVPRSISMHPISGLTSRLGEEANVTRRRQGGGHASRRSVTPHAAEQVLLHTASPVSSSRGPELVQRAQLTAAPQRRCLAGAQLRGHGEGAHDDAMGQVGRLRGVHWRQDDLDVLAGRHHTLSGHGREQVWRGEQDPERHGLAAAQIVVGDAAGPAAEVDHLAGHEDHGGPLPSHRSSARPICLARETHYSYTPSDARAARALCGDDASAERVPRVRGVKETLWGMPGMHVEH
eukprot:scaffold108891_cov54-Phaeocystis_antarctica.AAC.2